jgi:hypothetical protein
MTYAMMKKTTKLMPLKRHKRSQNTGVVYTLADEATVVESPMRFPPIQFRCAAATAASVVAFVLSENYARGVGISSWAL